MSWTAPPGTLGLIFDCDGTLADTMPLHYRAWSHILGRAGIPFSEERFYQLGGMPTAKIIDLLSAESGVPVADIPAMVQEKETAFLSFLAEVAPLPPVLAIAQAYRGQLPMAVASGGYTEIVKKTLQFIGVHNWFQAMVCAEDTPKHKPEPDVFLEAAHRLQITDVERVVVFEDTDIGLEAARRAGMQSVDVRPWLPPRRGEKR